MGKQGAPPKYTSVEQIEGLIEQYFIDCRGEPLIIDGEPFRDKCGDVVLLKARPPTVTGLALALGFRSRQALLNYQQKEAFHDTITRAKLRIEDYCEQRLFDRDAQRGAEFSLLRNFRWDRDQDGDKQGDTGVVIIPEVAHE